jgi:hypothetical protein
MGKLMNKMDNMPIPGSSFQYSAVRIEDLGATEYTLVTVAVDQSSSVSSFRPELIATLKEIVRACQRSPRKENLMIRVIGFNDNCTEVHGFKLLGMLSGDEYQKLSPQGMTALFDATYDAVAATAGYSKSLVQQDFNTNGIVFVITDGCDNRSKATPYKIAEAKKKSLLNEEIESLLTILIGVNIQDRAVHDELVRFEAEGEFDQFVELKDATADTLAKVGGFVSRSISSQSQALGTGGPSQPLTLH